MNDRDKEAEEALANVVAAFSIFDDMDTPVFDFGLSEALGDVDLGSMFSHFDLVSNADVLREIANMAAMPGNWRELGLASLSVADREKFRALISPTRKAINATDFGSMTSPYEHRFATPAPIDYQDDAVGARVDELEMRLESLEDALIEAQEEAQQREIERRLSDD